MAKMQDIVVQVIVDSDKLSALETHFACRKINGRMLNKFRRRFTAIVSQVFIDAGLGIGV